MEAMGGGASRHDEMSVEEGHGGSRWNCPNGRRNAVDEDVKRWGTGISPRLYFRQALPAPVEVAGPYFPENPHPQIVKRN